MRTIYVCNPKVAGQTIIRTLVAADNPGLIDDSTDINTPEIRWKISSHSNPAAFHAALNDPAFFRFTFVRDPYTRLVSCYRDKILNAEDAPRFWASAGLPSDRPASFTEFLRSIKKQNPSSMNRHWRPQSLLIPKAIELDFVGKFEQFSDDFHTVSSRLDLPDGSLKTHRPHSTGTGSHPSAALSKTEIDLINTLYRQDFLRFGYPMRQTEVKIP